MFACSEAARARTPHKQNNLGLRRPPYRHSALRRPRPSAVEVAMRRLSRGVRKAARYVGICPFVVYAALRQVRVHLFIIYCTVDLVGTYAPALADVRN